MTAVCVFCAANQQIDPIHIQHAFDVGVAIGKRGWRLVSGGGSVSSMGAVTKGARSVGGETIGVVPEVLFEKEVADHESTELIAVPDMRTRKATMENLSDAFVVLPGGIGTLEEFFEIWVAKSLGIHHKPVVVLDPDGMYEPLRSWLTDITAAGFVTISAANCIHWAVEIEQALDLIETELANPYDASATDEDMVESEI
jgi:uncharacterized protein (TIGR00730 family)